MSAVIDIHQLVKSFGANRALDGLELTVEPGQVHGFLGPNGAGKSTTIRILLGLMRPTSGDVSLLGGDPWRDAATLHRRLVYVPGDVALWPNLSGGETIELLGRMGGGYDAKASAELIDRFELDPRKKVRAYSTGNRQKVALIAAFAADAELLVLDEPSSGLDPLMEATFQSCVRESVAAGRTVLLSSHILSEVEALCDHVTIIRSGRVVESGTLAQLRHLTRTSVVADVVNAPAGLVAQAGIHDLSVDGDRLQFDVDTDKVSNVLTLLGTTGVTSFTANPPTLEELFMRHYSAQADDVKQGSPA